MCAPPSELHGEFSSKPHNDPYGGLLPSSTPQGTFAFAYLFVGAWGCRSDVETGLNYMRKRWYEPSVERFISQDPLGSGYLYTNNSPTQLTDILGLTPRQLTRDEQDRLNDALSYLQDQLRNSICRNFFNRRFSPKCNPNPCDKKEPAIDIFNRTKYQVDNPFVEARSGHAASLTDDSRCSNPQVFLHTNFFALPTLPDTPARVYQASILAHELLHLVTGLHDNDPTFRSLLREMYISCTGLRNTFDFK